MRAWIDRLNRRWHDEPLRRKGLIVIAIPLLMLLTIVPGAYMQQRQLTAEQARIAHTLQVEAAISTVLTLQLNAETGVRGYLLADDPRYLEPYDTARAQLPAAFDELSALVRNDQDQAARAQRVNALIASEMITLSTLRTMAQAGGDPTKEQLTASRNQMDTLRDELAAMSVEEEATLAAHRGEAQRLTRQVQIISLLVLIIGLIGSLLASLLFTRGIVRRIQQLGVAASALAQGHAPDAPPRGADEIGALGRQLVETGKLLLSREVALRESAAELEQRVTERTAALNAANAQLNAAVSDLEYQARDIVALNELGDYLQTCRSPEEAATIISTLGGYLFPASAGFVGVVRASQNLIEPLAVWGELDGLAAGFAPEECWALRRGRPHRVIDPATDPPCAHTPNPGPDGYQCLPLLADGEALGVLHLRLPAVTEPNRLVAQQRLAVAVAERMALALATLRLQTRLRDQSIRDPLTGLYNRRYLEESLPRELQRAGRQGESVAVIMLDIDHFKRFNDTFGHQAGDALLTEVGSYILTNIRGDDLACRYGGEELALILPTTDLSTATARAEMLREGLRNLTVLHQRQILGQITASLGVAIFPTHGLNADTLMHAADTSLYRAKREGRDRIALAS